VWGFYQLKLVSDTPGPGFWVRSKHEGKRKRGCPSPLLHVRLAHPGPRRPVVARRARRPGRADPVAPAVREECRVARVAALADPVGCPADPACLRAVPVVPGPAPVDVPAARVVPEVRVDLAVPVDPVVADPVGLAVPVVAARADPVGLAVPRGPTTAAPRLPRPPRCGWRPPRGAAHRA
jgi:hypothetical protein